MKLTNELYRAHKATVYSASRKIAKNYGAWDEKEEIEANAMLIFCESVESFNADLGANFNTHLSNNLRALSHKYDSRSACRQVLETNLSLSTPVITTDNLDHQELEDRIGAMDSCVSSAELWDFLAKVGDQDLCDLAFEVCFGDLDRKIWKNDVIAWGLKEKGWSTAESLSKRQELINAMKRWLKISKS